MERTLIDLLVRALQDAGINHIFGIPGDYALTIFKGVEESDIKMVNTCDEQGAGFAADAYARLKGLGCVMVTYGVGALKLVNTTAQAYAERSPVVVISGAPGLSEREGDPLLHHRVGDFETQLRVFEQVTAAQTVLSDARVAYAEINRVLWEARNTKRPVYIEIPRDMVGVYCSTYTPSIRSVSSRTCLETLGEALREVREMMNGARSPLILVGVEIHRLGLQDEVKALIRHSNIPFATTMMGKSVIPESEPGFIGVYSGGLSKENVRVMVEESDCLFLLGCMITDLNTGMFTTKLDKKRSISSTIDMLNVQTHQYPNVDPKSLVSGLLSEPLAARKELTSCPDLLFPKFSPAANSAITVSRLFDCLNAQIRDDIAVVADVGDALFASLDLTMREAEFVACGYYASLGFAVPGSMGVQLARPACRPLVLVGDGAFQMTGVELSSSARYGLSPIVVVLDNAGYGTERPMLDGEFNDVHPWHVSAITKLIGHGSSATVRTEAEFSTAIESALNDESLSVIHVHIAPDDRSPALERLTASLKQRV